MARRAKKEMMTGGEKGTRNVYNAANSPEMESAEDETAAMKKGGKVKKHMKRKHGGKIEGEKERARADKMPRGMHHKRASGGRTPYTSGHVTSEPAEGGKTNSGHEDQRPT